MAQIAKAEARMHDRRCAQKMPHMFLTFCRLRRQKLASAISTAIRKKRRRNQALTVSHVLNNASLEDLVQHNDGYRVLQVDRSSPAYWEKKRKHVLAMCRQFGMPSIFASFSCAETRWKELLVILKSTVNKDKITVDEAESLSWQEKVRIIQSDPITIVRYFSRRMAELLKLLQSPGGIFKKYRIVHSFGRFEFQQRGSSHWHWIAWLDGAPQYNETDPHSVEECVKFVDELVTCKEDPSLGDLLNVQYHKHCRTCHREVRGERVCRFGVPWPPMRATCILRPLDDSVDKENQTRLKTDFKSMQKVLVTLFKTRESATFDQFLDKLGWTEEQYMLTVRSTLRRPKIFLRRDVHEMKLNGYNKEILQLHDANIDMQFILDPYACVAYVVDYATKANRGVSKLLKETDDMRAGNAPLTEQLRAVSNVFVNKSEVSAQEVAFHNLSLPLSFYSDAEIYINTAPPEERTRILKRMRELEEIFADNPESTDILVSGLLEHYEHRPDELENCCLADFAAWFNFSKTKSPRISRGVDEVDDDFENVIGDNAESNNSNEQALKLKNNSGFLKKRTKPKVIRYRNYSASHDPDNYMRELLMLFTAWRDETELINNKRSLYLNSQEIIEKNRAKYVKLAVDLNEILQEVLENEIEEDCEDKDSGPPADFAVYELESGERADIAQDLPPDVININPRESERFLLPQHLPNEEYLANVARLNERQRRYHLNLIHHLKTRPSEPVRHFVSGGAGVGKSMLISVITQSSIRLFIKQYGSHPDDLTVLLMAPTGKAAYNISGVTVHSALHIFGQNQQMTLNADVLNSLRSELRHLKLIIIDEISMVGRRMFETINDRLQQIFDTKQFLGGIHVLAVGDFKQLKPVGDEWIFNVPNDPLRTLANSCIWRLFKFYVLTEIMRQREDARLAEALNRMALGETNAEDDAIFQSREMAALTAQGIRPPESAVDLFETNEDAEVHNARYLSLLNTESCESTAMDYCEGEGTSAMKQKQLGKIQNWRHSKTQNLPRHLIDKITARYMLTINLNTSDGLTNGAYGYLRHIAWGRTGDGAHTPIRLYVEFDEENVGKITRSDHREVMRLDGVLPHKRTPIERVRRCIIPTKGCVFKIIRKQFPLIPAKGITIHKSQGSTFKSVVVHLRTRQMERSMAYVAFSRVPSLSGLFINGKYRRPSSPKSTDAVVVEMRRLALPENLLSFSISFPELDSTPGTLKILFHNIRSLHNHHQYVVNEKSYTRSDIIIICETWTMPEDDIFIPGFNVVHRRDCIKNKRHAYGTIIFANEAFSSDLSVFYAEAENDQRGTKLHSFINIVGFSVKSQKTVAIVALYKSPKCTLITLKNQLNRCLDEVAVRGMTDVVVLGDFNVNVQDAQLNLQLSRIMTQRNLKLAISRDLCTTDSGTLIDLVYSNYQPLQVNVLESIISDHKPLWFTVPYL